MALYKNRLFLSAGITFVLIFAVLLSFRLDLYGKIRIRSTVPAPLSPGSIPGKDTWMNIYQQDRKIGYSHRRFSETQNGYSVQETVFMRINTMGMIQDVHLSTKGQLHRDFTLSSVDFDINSGRFSFSAVGRMDGSVLHVRTQSADATRSFKINLSGRTYLVAGLVHAAGAQGYKPGDRLVLDIFDPVTMSSQPVKMIFEDREEVFLGGIKHSATKVLLNFKGANQLAWIDDKGEILKEKGLLGIQMERTTREDAFSQFEYASSDDLTELASIPSNVKIETPATLKRLTVKISGVNKDGLHLNGGRQVQRNDTVTIRRESVANIPTQISPDTLPLLEKIFLKPEPFVQADHEKIKQQVEQVLAGIDEPLLSKAQRLVNWVHTNIEKRPVLSLPDALSTLENREGDCNEHAVLLAAMARAAGIPARIETGLVYMRGRFFYHAWNSLYLGEWTTADAVFNQLPADVTHIRFATGTKQQANLLGLINKVNLKVVDLENS